MRPSERWPCSSRGTSSRIARPAASRRGPRRARPCRSACRASRASTIRSTMRSASASSDRRRSPVLACDRAASSSTSSTASTRFASPAIATPYDEPARLAPHRLDDEVAAGRHRVGAQVLQLLRHHVDGGEEAEREVDAAVVVVDRLRQVDDLHAARLRRQVLLVLVQEVRRLQRVVAADRDQRVDLEIDERVVDVAQPRRLLVVVAGRPAS